MANITLAVDPELKSKLDKLKWVNISEFVRGGLVTKEKELELLERFKKIVSKSKLTEKGAKELADEIDKGMLRRLKEEYPELL